MPAQRQNRTARALVHGVERLLKAGVALAVLSVLCAGLPWALARFVGWPLPDHVPTAAELGQVLTAPPSAGFLLNVLACGAWLLWAAFIVEVIGCAQDLVRTAGRLHGGPLRRVAAVLITAVVVSFVSRSALAAGGTSSVPTLSAAAPQPAGGVSEDFQLVRPPHDGVHDSLYRIAQRRLGNGDRWPEVWRLNVGSAQPGGRRLTSPSLIHPGDRVRLPPRAKPAATNPPPAPLVPAEPATVPRPQPPAPAKPGAAWDPEVFVGLGVAGAISAALLVVRRRQRAAYRPGSGRRGDNLPVAPAVYELHLAHQQANAELEDANLVAAQSDPAVPSLGGPADDATAKLVLNLAQQHGLGLVGPGSHAAARALLLTAMTATPHPDVVAPGPDLHRLLGLSDQTDLPENVHIVGDLAAASAALDGGDRQEPPGEAPRIFVATAPADEEDRTRLQGAIESGHGSTIMLLLGQWQSGVTIYVDATGVITATSPGPGEPLRGRRTFSLPESATRELFALLHAAHDRHTDLAQDGKPVREPDQLEIAVSPSPAPTGTAGAEPRTVQVAEVPRGAAAPLVLSVFGPPRLSWRPDSTRPQRTVEVTGRLSRRLWELLVYLALHPTGAPRSAIVDNLWAGRTLGDPAAVVRTVISRIRSILEKATTREAGDLVVAEHGRYRLDSALVEVDYWTFAAALARRRNTTDEQERLAAYAAIVAGYGGELAAGLDAEWLTAPREGIRRDALDAVAALARARVRSDPESTLELLETARNFDPHNELLYRDIMRLEHNLGRYDAIARTLRLLEARLAEIDESPTAATIELASRLCALQTDITGSAT